MKKLIWFLERGTFLVFIALVFNACKNDTLIGLEVQPKGDQFNLQLEETFDIKATTIDGIPINVTYTIGARLSKTQSTFCSPVVLPDLRPKYFNAIIDNKQTDPIMTATMFHTAIINHRLL